MDLPSRALCDLGMVLGAVFFKGTETGSSFGIIFLIFVSGRTKIEKINMSQKWHRVSQKMQLDWGTSGNGFSGLKFQVFEGKTLDFNFLGFSDFGISCIFSHLVLLSDVVGHEF